MIKFDPIVREDLVAIAEALMPDAKKLSGKTVLITGGSGFLGRYMVSALLYLNENHLQKPCKIISIDNYITSSSVSNDRYLKSPHLQRIRHDVTKPLPVRSSIDYIIHAAGIASPIYYRKYPLEAIDVAVNGTRAMLELAKKKKVKSIVFFSSSEIYGDPTPDALPTPETYKGNVSPIGPRACYDESKRMGETLCMTYYEQYNVPAKIIRPFNIYGPGMRRNDYRVIPMFVYDALKGKSLPVHVRGNQTRAFCYIADATAAFLKILLSDKDGEVYNVGNDTNETTIKDLAVVLNKIFDNALTIDYIEYPKNYPQGEPQRRFPNLQKIKHDLGYTPKVNLETGLQRTITWCKNNWSIGKRI